MTIEDTLEKLALELRRIHSDDFDWSEMTFPDFTTSDEGYQISFSKDANLYMLGLSELVLENLDKKKYKTELRKIQSFMRYAVANLFASGELTSYIETDSIQTKKNVEKKLKDKIEGLITRNSGELTHHYSASTVFLHHHPLVTIGPVEICNIEDWIKKNDFDEKTLDKLNNQKALNHKWKEQAVACLNNHKEGEISSLAEDVYQFTKTGNSVISIKLNNFESELSSKLSRIICKTTLDALSTLFGDKNYFFQNALYEDRMPPVSFKTFKSRNGKLILPGFTLSKRIPIRNGSDFIDDLKNYKNIIDGFAFILYGLSQPDEHPYPQLSNRWATALEWYAEAQRETNESIALAKLGTCLDILSSGGKKVGITNLICHLLSIDENYILKTRKKEIKLKDVIAKLYNYGRSQILHGNHVDRLQSFEKECADAAYFARIALLEVAIRLQHYQGDDSPTAFRTIPKLP